MFGIYIHWPYCLSKCPYCDFNSHVAERVDDAAWRVAYASEIQHVAAKTPEHIVSSIYFGGGTPSLMAPKTVEFVIDQVQQNWRMSNNVEVTLEANPTSIEQEKFSDFKAAGITRVSVGVQALNDKDLKFLGRQHTAKEAKAALEIAYNTFERVSFDLIYARPEQNEAEWERELRQALDLATAGHLSLYQLTIEPGTAFETMYARREFDIPDDELGGRLYEMTGEIAAAHGLQQYEISNYARDGEESRHNLTYWRYKDYAGIGPGAHGRLTINGKKYATRTHRAPKIWLEKVRQSGHGYHPFTDVPNNERTIECLIMGLRLSEGVELRRLIEEGGETWRDALDEKKLAEMISAGYMNETSDILQATPAGRQRLNSLLPKILI